MLKIFFGCIKFFLEKCMFLVKKVLKKSLIALLSLLSQISRYAGFRSVLVTIWYSKGHFFTKVYQRTNQQINQQTTRLLKLLRAAKKIPASAAGICLVNRARIKLFDRAAAFPELTPLSGLPCPPNNWARKRLRRKFYLQDIWQNSTDEYRDREICNKVVIWDMISKFLWP